MTRLQKLQGGQAMKEQIENEMKLEFLNKGANEAFARITVAAFASQLDPTIEELADIKTAVSEAVTNSIIHGYNEKGGDILMECTLESKTYRTVNELYCTSSTITIEIEDFGVGIENIEKAREPLFTTKPDLERSGMGFMFMEMFMDRVDVKSKPGVGTKLTMRKIIKKLSK